MHELGLMENIVATVQSCARENGAEKVLKVILEVGSISGVVPESLEFCFGVCVQGTLLEGAQLEIIRVPARGKCRKCAHEFDLAPHKFSCPRCQQADWELLAGKELIIKALEVT